jgi:splicing factor 3B subunit 3
MEQISSFYVGEVITSIQKTTLATSGNDIILYSTINGTIGALCPFETREDVDFFLHLEMYVRNLTPSLSGRDHLVYRSMYSPCKAIIDGELCETYNKLSYEEQVEIGKHLERTPQEIEKKLE